MAGMFTDPRKGKRPCGHLDSLSPALVGRANLYRPGLGPQGRCLSPKRRAWRRRNSKLSPPPCFLSGWRKWIRTQALLSAEGPAWKCLRLYKGRMADGRQLCRMLKGLFGGPHGTGLQGVRDQRQGFRSVLGEHLSQHQAGKEQSPLMKLCNRRTAPVPLAPCWSCFLNR